MTSSTCSKESSKSQSIGRSVGQEETKKTRRQNISVNTINKVAALLFLN